MKKSCQHNKFIATISVLLLLFVLHACKNNNETKPEKSALSAWLNKPENVDNKSYRDTFSKAFNTVIAENKIAQASTLLDAYGNALDLRYEYDSLFIKQCKSFLNQYEKQLDIYHQVALNYFMGSQYDFAQQTDSSNFFLTKAYIKTTNSEALKLKGFAGIILHQHFSKNGKYEQALQQCIQNLKLFESIKDSVNVATTYINMSDVYKQIKMYEESKLYNTKALAIALAVKDTQNIWTAYVNHIRPFGQEINYNTSLIYAKKVKALYDAWSHKSDYFGSTTHFYYGFALLHNKQLDSVQYYIDKSSAQCKNNTLLQFDLIATYADLDKALKRPIHNVTAIEEAYQFAIKEKDQKYQETFAEVLAEIAYQKGDYKKAYEYNHRKYALRDSSWNTQTRSDLASLDKKYQSVKKEKTIAEQNSKLQKSKFKITVLLSSLIGLSLLAIAFFAYRKRKEVQAEVIRQQKFTDELLQNTEDERKRIATDLHDGVNHELLSLKNQASSGKLANADELEKVINEVRQVSRDLYPAMFDNIGLAASIEALCERMTEAGLFTTSEINYTLKLSKRNELQLYRIIQEALNNTLKHAKANAAKVTIDTQGNELLVEIKDNGIGFNTEEKMNNASSFGLQSLMQRARAIGGKSSFESNENGTKLILKTPIH
jgi:two-component system, NarL family, sensor kinase